MNRYMGPILAVSEIAPARHFYETLLQQTVKYDFGVNVTFVGDFSVHLRSHLRGLQGLETAEMVQDHTPDAELTFETDDIDGLEQRLSEAQVEFVHGSREQPWGQRVVRVYDRDGYVVEIGEEMTAVVRRMSRQGQSAEQIVEKTAMPSEFVEQALSAGA